MANESPKNHSEANCGVLKSGCTVYNCINADVSACIQCASYGVQCTTVSMQLFVHVVLLYVFSMLRHWTGFGGCTDRLYSLE